MSKIIAIVNQKGGVGKTTTSINLSTAFAAVGKSTLLVDLDPQGNASTGLGISYRSREEKNIYKILLSSENKLIELAIFNIKEIPNLSLISSVVDLSAAEIELSQLERGKFVLKSALEKICNNYEYIIIDCPPSLGLLTINALTAADSIIVPLQCEFFALEGLSHLVKTVELIKRSNLNPFLAIEGIVLTMYDRRNKLSEQIKNDICQYLNDKVYKTIIPLYETIIPRNVRLSEAPSHGKPAIVYDLKCPGAQAYISLAKEILKKHANSCKEKKLVSGGIA
ncbi:MAG: ParA family protein [Rickettsiales bacterium]|nr:ParA family protein [Rickettsiales bacterium]